MLNIPSLEYLIHELSRLPGIGQKTAQRLAYHILREPKEFSERLRDALKQVEENVGFCAECFNYSEAELCTFCSDHNRNSDVFCVVEEPTDITRIENSGSFRGRYHVLQGSIAPLDGVSAKDLKIAELFSRLDEAEAAGTPVQEIILALDADLEGDTTALYLKRELAGRDIKLTRIAHGVPFGTDIDYIDYRTLGLALNNRVEL